jgi:hypothetical protein
LSLQDQRDYYSTEVKRLQRVADSDRSNIAKFPAEALHYQAVYASNRELSLRCEERAKLIAKIDSLNITIKYIDSVLLKRDIIRTESAEMAALGSDGPINNDVKYENLVDVAGEEHHQVDAGDSRNSQQGQKGILDVHDFFSRPVKLYENTLALSTDINIALKVWNLYSLIPSVRAKMRNFAYMRGDLHVRIAASGTPFHYGRLLLSYQPFALYNPTLQQYLVADALDSGFHPLLLNYLSQAEGSVTLDVKENAPVEVVCPFISTKPMHRLFDTGSTAISAASVLPDFEVAGDLYIYSLNQIKAVSATPSTVYLQVYAWMENVELGTNTATQLAITTESGPLGERTTGPVQRVASSLYDVASRLTDVPIIAPFAKASQLIFGALKGVASLFGWSKPVIVQKPTIVKNEPYQNGAITIGCDTNKRIVLDPTQELTVDPRVTGVSEDEMTIRAITTRRSFLQSFAWNDNSGTLASPLWSTRIAPTLVTSYLKTSIRYNQPTALAYAAAPFTYWRGDIIFRFEIVCSAFHRGKLAVYFEPNQAQKTLIDTAVSLNKQYIRVVDIQDTQIFDVRVNWASYRAWLRVQQTVNAWLNNSTPTSSSSALDYINGYIAVVPFTRLQSPDNSDISVNVYVMSDNMQFNCLSSYNMPTERRILTESGPMTQEISSKSSNAPQAVSCIDLNESSATTSTICSEHFGEQPLSFRSLLKRYVTMTGDTILASSDLLGRYIQPIYPINMMPYGVPTGVETRYQNLFSYLKMAYLGIRGGMRYRVRMTLTNNTGPMSAARVSLMPPSSTATTGVSFVTDLHHANLEGSITVVPNTMGACEVELPHYSGNLFAICFKDDYTINYNDVMDTVWWKYFKFEWDNPVSAPQNYVAIDIASAEDFTLMRFQGAPMYTSA